MQRRRYQERAAYMESIVVEFRETFDTYIIQIEDYDYLGQSTFSVDPTRGLFVEVVNQDEKIPKAAIPTIKSRVAQDTFCAQDEMKMFTDNGWNYSFTLKHAKTQKVTTVICQPKRSGTA